MKRSLILFLVLNCVNKNLQLKNVNKGIDNCYFKKENISKYLPQHLELFKKLDIRNSEISMEEDRNKLEELYLKFKYYKRK